MTQLSIKYRLHYTNKVFGLMLFSPNSNFFHNITQSWLFQAYHLDYFTLPVSQQTKCQKDSSLLKLLKEPDIANIPKHITK